MKVVFYSIVLFCCVFGFSCKQDYSCMCGNEVSSVDVKTMSDVTLTEAMAECEEEEEALIEDGGDVSCSVE